MKEETINFFKFVLTLFLFILLSLFLSQKINLATADLGRHIKNGEVLLRGNKNVLFQNLYSYTYKNFPFLNHHWLTGVVFYSIYSLTGFIGLHVFAISLILLTFLLFFNLARKEGGWELSFFLSLFLIPLIAYRHEVRPEIFSALFFGVFFVLLSSARQKQISLFHFLILGLTELLWVNLHIYFILGILVTGAYFTEKLILSYKRKKILFSKSLLLLFFLILVSLINPSGWKGLIHPFEIYNNYGYRVLEEQSVWFLENKVNIHKPVFLLFKLNLLLLLISFVIVLKKEKSKFSLFNFFVTAGLTFMAVRAIRDISLFALLSLPVISTNLSPVWDWRIKDKEDVWGMGVLNLLFPLLLFSFVPLENSGIGLLPGIENSAHFFLQNNLQGPIFNNYDIGSYLIFYLFPQKKVFVDNRPEAYPAKFLQKTYIASQNDLKVWQETEEKYDFQTIFFYLHDATPWGQNFLKRVIDDNQWVPIYVDPFAIIFVKNNKENEENIQKYQIPRQAFRFTSD